MDSVMRGARRVSQWSLWFSGALVLLAAVLIGIDVVLRKLFSTSIGGADELAGYALAIGAAWSLAAALLDRAHIRIDSLYVLLPIRMRLVLDFAGLALFVAFFSLIAWHGSSMVMQSWRSASRSQSALQTPTVIPQSIWILGLVIFVVIGALLFVHALMLVRGGRLAEAASTISTRSAEEEIMDEVRDLVDRQSRATGSR